jgi:hypothetical protein
LTIKRRKKVMKKLLLVAVVVAMVVSVFAHGVFAFGPGPGFGPYGMYNPQWTTVSPEQFSRFQQAVQPLRDRLFQLKTELRALMGQPTPDYRAIADKQKQMVDVRVEIQKRANEAGISAGGCGCMGGGPGNPVGFRGWKRGVGQGYRL